MITRWLQHNEKVLSKGDSQWTSGHFLRALHPLRRVLPFAAMGPIIDSRGPNICCTGCLKNRHIKMQTHPAQTDDDVKRIRHWTKFKDHRKTDGFISGASGEVRDIELRPHERLTPKMPRTNLKSKRKRTASLNI